jgi:hypothetical protein
MLAPGNHLLHNTHVYLLKFCLFLTLYTKRRNKVMLLSIKYQFRATK